MHFWVSTVRGGFQGGFCCPRKIGTNWFIPALVNSRFGESGSNDAEGTMVCSFSRKKSRNDWRISAAVMIGSNVAAVYLSRHSWRRRMTAESVSEDGGHRPPYNYFFSSSSLAFTAASISS